ncbi:putative HxlR family transcriptional regulator [Nocardia brasiliensis NBRC 14402]|nr:putative HxlR family transcriptional regulator [Nocardia brasiliensis NBRC 14402]
MARALDVLGERWTLLIVRELLLGASSFGDLSRGLPRIPRATLSARLRTLRAAGVVEGYRLTDAGAALAPVVRELARWAITTDSAALTEDDLDTAALTWDMRRRVDTAALPDRRVVVAIEFTDRPASDRRFWLHLDRAGVDLCRDDTGAPIDIWLTTPTRATTEWWLGNLSWSQLLRQPGVQVHGDLALQRQIPRWFTRYVFTPDSLGANST